MMQISLVSENRNNDKAEMFIGYVSETIGFTVVTADDKQLDFIIEKEEWSQFVTFIDMAMARDVKTGCNQ